jgi:glyoxylase-like metal-dependent hydrolase (beta-lactamase superfamily II)/rhodanese-related sulfurtransferase
MYFQQFYLTCLAQASYMIGAGGVAAVVDPQRDIDIYLEEAERQGFKIAYVIETHLHADFVSGHRELAARTGAKIYLGAAANAQFEHVAVKDGDTLRIGREGLPQNAPVELRFLATPGHTPESVCVLITDLSRSDQPCAVLTGDTLFIGDVGRPDLSPAHTPQELAGLLYDSLHQKLLTLPDQVEVYPAHGAGSLCGKNMSSERSSTIGDQRKLNYALQPMSRESFIAMMTCDLPERPEYFAQDAEINRRGPALLTELPPPQALSPEAVWKRIQQGVVALDTRPAAQFGAGHVPGAINIGLSGQYATWAATVIGLGKPLVLIAEDDERVRESHLRLARVGIETVTGYLDGGMMAWEQAGLPVTSLPQMSVHQLRELEVRSPENGWQIVDVRRLGEWKAGHLPGAVHLPLDRLSESLGSLDPEKPTAIHCKSGYRSSIACGLLQAQGFKEVHNVVGGYDAWVHCAFPTVISEVPGPSAGCSISRDS